MVSIEPYSDLVKVKRIFKERSLMGSTNQMARIFFKRMPAYIIFVTVSLSNKINSYIKTYNLYFSNKPSVPYKVNKLVPKLQSFHNHNLSFQST